MYTQLVSAAQEGPWSPPSRSLPSQFLLFCFSILRIPAASTHLSPTLPSVTPISSASATTTLSLNFLRSTRCTLLAQSPVRTSSRSPSSRLSLWLPTRPASRSAFTAHSKRNSTTTNNRNSSASLRKFGSRIHMASTSSNQRIRAQAHLRESRSEHGTSGVTSVFVCSTTINSSSPLARRASQLTSVDIREAVLLPEPL